MPHLILLGDSIFDNAAYTSGGPDVIRQVQQILAADWRATLLAVDGHVTADVPDQLQLLPADATHLVLSVGGNDALQHLALFDRPVSSMAAALEILAQTAQEFRHRYAATLAAIHQCGLPLMLCTIYEGCFPDPRFQKLAGTALTLFNDVILRLAFAHAHDVIDLRVICSRPEDYANPIEPSSAGGWKIARAVVTCIMSPRSEEAVSRVFTH